MNEKMGTALSEKMRTGAELIVETLAGFGVDTIFGLPGDTGVGLYNAMYDNPDTLKHILVRDERHAVAMADSYARLTGTVGVAEVSSGGGTTYAVGGLGEAMASGIPLLLITSDIHSSSRGTGALTEIDQVALFTAVTKWRAVVENVDQIPNMLRTAMREATTGRPGPVAIIVPEGILDEVSSLSSVVPDPEIIRLPGERPAARQSLIESAADRLQAAQQPVLVLGSGVFTSRAEAAVVELAEQLGAGIATSIHGRGTVADHDPHLLGISGNNGGQPGTNRYLEEADVVLFIGTRANATNTNGFTCPQRGRVFPIHIDMDSAIAGVNYPDGIALIGDALTVVRQLIAALDEVAPQEKRSRLERIAAARADVTDPHDTPGQEENGPAAGLLPADCVKLIASLVPEAGSVFADPGTPTPNVANYWPVSKPGRTVIIPRGHGPMGYAIPAAVGGYFATKAPVVSFTADGSFGMASGELETVSRFKLPILYVQFTNHSYGWIKMLQHLYYDKKYFGVDPGTIDPLPVAMASGFAKTARPTTLAELETVVREFAQNPQPTYVDIEVPHMIAVTPPVPAWYAALGGNSERPVY
ncbi:acetolactate synthase large subunit [Leucobacter sp. BZR 635]